MLLGGVIFAGLTIATKGGFPRHIILYNINSFSLKEVYHKLSDTLTTYPLYLLLALGTAAMVGARL